MKKLPMTLMAALTAAVALTVDAGSVFDDSRFWFNGGTDIDNSGVFKTGDFTDVFHVANPPHELNQQGIHGCTTPGNAFTATTSMREIVLPMTGEAKTLRVVNLPQAAKPNSGATDYQLWPNCCGFETAGACLCVTDSYTFVWRMKRHGLSHGKTKSYIMRGYYYGTDDGTTARGFDLLLDSDGKIITDSRHRGSSWKAWGDVSVPDEEWVDLAVVMRGTGFNGAYSTLYLATSSGGFVKYDNGDKFWGNMCLATIVQQNRSLELFHNIRQDSARMLKDSVGWGLEWGLPVEFQQFAIWDRSLDEFEVKEAFGLLNGHTKGAGRFDGSSDDLNGGKLTAYTMTEDIDGSAAPSVLSPNSSVAYTVNLPTLDPSYAFFVGTAKDSPTGTFEVRLNGLAVATKQINGGGIAAFVAKTKFFKTGENVITLKRIDNVNADIALDAVRLESTWQLGVRNNSWNEFGGMGGVGDAYDLRNNYTGTDLKKVRNGICLNSTWPGQKRDSLSVPISAEMAATCSFNYTVPMTAWGDDATQPATIKLTVNGVEKLSFSSTEIAGSWVEKTASFSPGELKAGQNEFVWTISGDRTDNNPTIGFDCHTFSLTPERHGLGTFIVVE